jgi:hypothetical protein
MTDVPGAALNSAENRIQAIGECLIAPGATNRPVLRNSSKTQLTVRTDQISLAGLPNTGCRAQIENGRPKDGLIEKIIDHGIQAGHQANFFGTDFAQMLFDSLPIVCLRQMDCGFSLVASFTEHVGSSLPLKCWKRSGWPEHF